MFGQNFYFSTIRKYVTLFGTLFDDISIIRTNRDGALTAVIKVPITYAPKEKMLARLQQDPAIDRQTAVPPLPFMSFEMTEMKYDSTRKLNTIGKVVTANNQVNNSYKYQYNPVPYDFNFKVYIYTKNAEDGTKIIEQILPFFTPDWTTTVKLIPEVEEVKDIPIVLNDISYEDRYDGQFENRRAIVWSLDLTLNGYLYGPIKKGGIIKFIDTTFYIPSVPDGKLADAVGVTPPAERVTIQPGMTPQQTPINYYGGARSEEHTSELQSH